MVYVKVAVEVYWATAYKKNTWELDKKPSSIWVLIIQYAFSLFQKAKEIRQLGRPTRCKELLLFV